MVKRNYLLLLPASQKWAVQNYITLQIYAKKFTGLYKQKMFSTPNKSNDGACIGCFN
jgi:hypothetical protein